MAEERQDLIDLPKAESASSAEPSPVQPGTAATAQAPVASAPPPSYASIYPGPTSRLPGPLVAAVRALEDAFQKKAWLLVQQHSTGEYGFLDSDVWCGFFRERGLLRQSDGCLLIIESPGGLAHSAYKIARLLKRCGGFTAIVPSYAKSAATLLALGGSDLYMGPDSELGPLDAQSMDPEREDVLSALDEVQALERLHSSALAEIDKAMVLLLARTGKRVDTLLPMVMRYEADLLKPLFEKIDAVHYTQQNRALKVAEDYAIRLLAPRYHKERSESVARRLVNFYSEHGFVIDREEAASFLDVATPNKAQARAIEMLEAFLAESNLTAVGRVLEVSQGGSEGADVSS